MTAIFNESATASTDDVTFSSDDDRESMFRAIQSLSGLTRQDIEECGGLPPVTRVLPSFDRPSSTLADVQRDALQRELNVSQAAHQADAERISAMLMRLADESPELGKLIDAEVAALNVQLSHTLHQRQHDFIVEVPALVRVRVSAATYWDAQAEAQQVAQDVAHAMASNDDLHVENVVVTQHAIRTVKA